MGKQIFGKRIFTALLAATLMGSCLIGSVHAAEPAPAAHFQDVPADAPYMAGVQYAYEHGITLGTGADTFSPDRTATFGEFAVMTARVFCPESTWDSGTAIAKLAELMADPIPQPEAPITRAAAYRAVFLCKELPVYSATSYLATDTASAADCIFTASAMGLCEADADPESCMTRSELVQLLYQLCTESYTEATLPQIAEKLSLEVEPEFTATIGEYLSLAAKVPVCILDLFKAEGWKFVIGDDYINEWTAETGIPAAALTNYEEQVIYVFETKSVVHELGHFLHRQHYFPTDWIALYYDEAEAAGTVLEDYATTNDKEYFAEMFEAWLLFPEMGPELKRVAPLSWAYFEELEESGWVPAPDLFA